MRRRILIGGAGATGLAGLGAFVYRAAPTFWKQYSSEIGRPIAQPMLHPDPKAWPDTGLHASWLGHSTVLIKADGTTILTDPVFSDRVGLSFGPLTLGLKRLVAPAAPLSRLPKVDLVVLSHAHMDHLDLPSLRALESRHTSLVTASKTSDLVRQGRYRDVRELRWNETASAGAARIRAFEVNHWGARMRTDTYRGYNGYVIEVGRYRILFGGDTAMTTGFRRLKSSRPFDLAIMPIGAYNPWIHAHCTPEQALQMGNDAGADRFIPVHHQTFQLSREPLLEPIERFYSAAGTERVAISHLGQKITLS
ncbi:MAG TPA: MBL fold metallo-hydrolase [Bryobacteraceae bacterium]|nr:MBL fold metallo-hydrolase [Bryobacteraceae bacterium]